MLTHWPLGSRRITSRWLRPIETPVTKQILPRGLAHSTGQMLAIWVAQGRSEHITGNAFDLNLGIRNSRANAEAGLFDGLATYRWLRDNAANYGLNPYGREPWHWSYNVVH